MDDPIGRGNRQSVVGALGLPRRCTATNRLGQQCQRAPIPGGFVCSMHGGKSPQVQRAAEQRLLRALGEPALLAIHRALQTAPPCEHCGRSDSDHDPVVIRAAQIALDRCGFGPSATVSVKPGELDQDLSEYVCWIPDDRLRQIGEWIDEAKQLMLNGAPRADIRPPWLSLTVLDAEHTVDTDTTSATERADDADQ